MNLPPRRDRLEIWRYTYARSSLLEARQACKTLLAKPISLASVEKALICQIVIADCRPFTKSHLTSSQSLPTFCEKLIPVSLKTVHNSLKEMRDCAIGHQDATAFPNIALNKVVIQVMPPTELSFTAVFPTRINCKMLRQTIQLCDKLISDCEQHLLNLASVHLGGTNRPAPGRYVMSTDENPTRWIIPQDTELHLH